jgi:hypothetical protein
MHLDLTENQETVLESESLGKKIELIIQKLPPKEVNFVEIMDIVGKDSLILLTIFLSLVFLVPVSIPGVSTVFGAGILLIGITRLFNYKPWLPKALAYRQLSSEQLRAGFKRALVWFNRLEKISRPHRLPQLTSAGWVIPMNNLSFILAALLLMVPFGFIPFSNTLPALALIFLAVGMLQRDGVFILLGNLVNGVTIIYFAILFAAGGWSINELFQFLS